MNEPASLEPTGVYATHIDADQADRTGDTEPPLPVGGSVVRALANLAPMPCVRLRDPAGESHPPQLPAGPQGAEKSRRLELLEEIASGGMGVVLRGRDADLGRDVAVKVLLERHAGQPQLLQRFVEEAQVAAQLQHPGVAPVYDLGLLPDHRPYFTMKLVKGQTLAQLLEQRPGPSQDLPRFVSIFAQVCQAVAYAHARGVIHRDLKPSNVMVGTFGEVQVMDWGLAKVLSAGTGASRAPLPPEAATVIQMRASGSAAEGSGTPTEAGTVLGTPAYMAPEQALGEVDLLDERCDVFGLGAMLCEILTGRPPYTGAGRAQRLWRAARADLGEALARLGDCGAGADLVEVARRCLAVEPGDRPADAGEVAAAVRSHLESVQLRLRHAELERAAAEAKAVEERKRRRLAVALAAVVVAALALGGGAAAWYQRDRARRQADAAVRQERAEVEATAALHEAEARLQEGRDLRDRDPLGCDAAVRLARAAQVRAETAVANAAVDAALADRVRQARAEVEGDVRDSALRLQLDRIRLDQAANKEGHFDEAAAAPRYRAVLRHYGVELADTVESARVARASRLGGELVAALADWARVTADAGERKQLVALLEAVEKKDRRADPWRTRWRAAVRAKDGAALAALARQAGKDLAAADVANLAMELMQLRQLDAAVELLRRGRERFPEDFWLNHHLGMALRDRNARSGEGVPYLMVAAALRPQSPGTHVNLGKALHEKGDLDGAARCFHRALDLDPDFAMAHNNLGVVLRARGEVDAAIRCYHKALDLDPTLALAHNNLGAALREKGDVEGALRCYHKALDLNPKLALAHYNVGSTLQAKGDLVGAIRCLQRAIELDPEYAQAHTNLGIALKDRGDIDGALRCFQRALDIDPKLAEAHGARGQVLLWRGEFAQARDATRRALDLLPATDSRRSFAVQQLQQCEAGLALAQKLPAVLQGKARPANAAEALSLAYLCQQPQKQLHAAAVRLFAEAFAAQPKLATDMPPHRYNAACSAALAAAGKGHDADKLDAQGRGSLRRQALAWLRADLDAWGQRLADAHPPQRQAVLQNLRHWQQDTDLEGVRDAKALAALPAEERDAWKKLWADVADLANKAGPPH
jgi:serine/threonine-protein kinase